MPMVFSNTVMRSVTVRQFQRSFYTELKSAPFIVTRQIWEDAPNATKGEKVRIEREAFIVLPYNADNLALAQEALKPKEQLTAAPEQNTPPVVQPQESKGFMSKLFKKL